MPVEVNLGVAGGGRSKCKNAQYNRDLEASHRSIYCIETVLRSVMAVATESAIRLVTGIPGPRSKDLAQRRESAIPRGIGSSIPIYVKRAEGAIVEDIDGNQFIDFVGGIGCQNAGHRAPETVSAIHEQVDQFLDTCFMVTPYEGYLELAELLNSRFFL